MRRAGSWILFAVLALSLAVRVEAAGRAVAVVVDVTGEVTVHRQGEPRAIAAYVGMDLFEGDRLSAAGAGEVTAFYEAGGTVKHDVAAGLVVAASAPDAAKPGVLSRLGSSLSDLFGTRTNVRADEAGAVEAGLVMARVAEEEIEPRKKREREAVSREAKQSRAVDRVTRSGGPEPARTDSRPATLEGGAPGGERPPEDGESTSLDDGPSQPREATAPSPATQDVAPQDFQAPQLPPPPAPRPPGGRSAGGLLEEKSVGGGGGTPATPAPKGKAVPAPWREGDPKRHWLPGLELDAALARARSGAVDGSLPAPAAAPAGGRAWLAMPRGERVTANLAFPDGAAVTLQVRPASGAGWSLVLTLAPAAEFAPVLANARALADNGQMGQLLAARMLEQKGFRLAAYLVQRRVLMQLRERGRSPVVLKRLAHQVAERALELGDFETVALLGADL